MSLPSCLFADLPLEMSCQPLPESPAPCSCCTGLLVNYGIHLFEFAAYPPVRAPVNQMPKAPGTCTVATQIRGPRTGPRLDNRGRKYTF
jgi:hypothetical protein